MGNKEVIIDGVNVAGCEFAEESATTPKCRINNYIHCDGYNCHYKQLQRLQAENEELEEKYNEYVKFHHYNNAEFEQERNSLIQEIQYKNRYNQALEKIKDYTRKQFCDNCEDIGSTEYSCHCEYCDYQEYFDIINEVKE